MTPKEYASTDSELSCPFEMAGAPSLASLCHRKILTYQVRGDPCLTLAEHLETVAALCLSRGYFSAACSYTDEVIMAAEREYRKMNLVRAQVMSVCCSGRSTDYAPWKDRCRRIDVSPY